MSFFFHCKVYFLLFPFTLLTQNHPHQLISSFKAEGYITTEINVKDLSNYQITAFSQDSDGLMYVGTTQGFFTFDGFRLSEVIEKNKIKSSSLKNVRYITNSDDFVWVGTLNGIYQYHKKEKRIVHWTNNEDTGLPSYHVHSLYQDGNTFWAITDGRNPVYLSPNSSKFQPILWKEYVRDEKISDKVYVSVYSIIKKDKNSFWLFSNIGLFEYNQNTQKFKYYEVENKSILQTSSGFQHNNGLLYINLDGYGLAIFDPKSQKFSLHEALPPSVSNTSTDHFIRIIYSDFDNSILVPTVSGLYRYDISSETWVKTQFINKNPTHNLWIGGNAIFKDIDTSIWLGSLGQIIKIDPEMQANYHVSFEMLEGRTISTIYEDEHILIIGTKEKGALHLYQNRKPNSAKSIGVFENVLKIFKTENDNFIIVDERKIYIFNSAKNLIYPIIHQQLQDVVITDACIDNKGELWITTRNDGLFSMHTSTHTLSKHNTKFGVYSKTHFNCLYCDTIRHQIWYGSFDNYLGIYDIASQKSIGEYIQGSPNSMDLSTPKKIISIDNNNILVIGDIDGFTRIERSQDSFIFHNQYLHDKIQTSKVLDITQDENGQFLILTATKIFSFNKNGTTQDVSPYISWLGSDPFKRLLPFKNKGILFSEKDKNIFIPNFETSKKPIQPRVFINSLSVNNEKVHMDSASPLLLKHNENNLFIEHGMKSYTHTENIKIYFRLIESNQEWTLLSVPGFNNMTNMATGQYTYAYKACAHENNCSKIQTFSFVIRPHFSRTWWFTLLLSLIFAGTVYALYRYRLYQLRQVEKVRNQIAADLHDDVASTVSSISFYSEFGKSRLPKEEVVSMDIYEKIGNNSREALESMREAIWSTQSKFDTLDELVKKIIQFATQHLSTKNITLNVNPANDLPDKKITPLIRRNIYLVAKESIHNIAKHAHASHVDIKISFQKPLLIIEITDDGKGFDVDQVQNGNGLDNMKKRAQLSHAQLDIQSKPGEGCKTRLGVRV